MSNEFHIGLVLEGYVSLLHNSCLRAWSIYYPVLCLIRHFYCFGLLVIAWFFQKLLEGALSM